VGGDVAGGDVKDEAHPMNKDDIAKGFAVIAAPVIAERGKTPIRAGKGRSRPVFTVAPSGEVTGIVPHAAVVQGLLVKQGVVDAVVDGARPKSVVCDVCQKLLMVRPDGNLPKRHPECRVAKRKELCKTWRANNAEKERERNAKRSDETKARLAKWRAQNPDKQKEYEVKYRAENADKVRARRAKYKARKRAEVKAAKASA
jgi:hypothetical protein